MIERIKNILLKPREEWPRIDAEPMTESGIFTGWVLPLAAIGPVCGLIGGQVFGYGAFGVTYKPPLMFSLVTAVLGYVLAIVGVWVVAKIVDALAPTFGGTKNPISALKVVAFSYTASFVAGVFGIIPALAILGIVGLYGLYLLYLGLPVLMKAPQEKAIGYTVVTVLCAIVVQFVIGIVVAAIASAVAAPALPGLTGSPTVVGEVTVPGVGSVDLAKMEAATKQMEAAANQAAAAGAATGAAAGAGAVKAVDPQALAGLLPQSAAGWSRTAIESSGGSAAGIGGAKAEGEYALGSDTANLSVTDLSAMGALAALGSAFNVQSNRTTATGYEKTGQVDGRMTSEEWDNGSRHGKYMTVVDNRFVVEVSGNAQSIDQLKALAASVDLGRVAALAK